MAPIYINVLERQIFVLFPFTTSLILLHLTRDSFPSLPITLVQASTHSRQLIHSNCVPFLISIWVGHTVTQCSQAVQSAPSGSSFFLKMSLFLFSSYILPPYSHHIWLGVYPHHRGTRFETLEYGPTYFTQFLLLRNYWLIPYYLRNSGGTVSLIPRNSQGKEHFHWLP